MFQIPLIVTLAGVLLACASPVAEVVAEPRQAADPTPSADPCSNSAACLAWLPDGVRPHVGAIDRAAAAHGVDPRLVAIVVALESAGRPEAVSPVGARGLMQLMPATASEIARAHGLSTPTPAQLLEVELNLDLGVRHLADLIADFGDASLDDAAVHRVATAYNGGVAVVLEAKPPSAETQRYASAVRAHWRARNDVRRPASAEQ